MYIIFIFIIYLKENLDTSFNLNKSKFCTIINYIKFILILYLIDACVLINILIIKKNKDVVCKFISYLY